MVPAAPKDPMERISKVDEKNLLKVDHDKYKTMYPYVMDTFKRMIENSTFIPQIADLLPFSLSKGDSVRLETYASTHQLRMSKPDQLVEALIKDKDIVSLAISGQHSSHAQQLIMNSAKVPEKIKNHNRYRKSRILDGQHESWKYHDISYQDNKNNEQAYYVPSFVECLRQARSQWIDLNRPQGAQGSNKKNPVFEQFKSTVSQTMGRKSYKEVISLVCCSDDTFKEFENFVSAWQKGEIPDVYGALGKPKGERDVGKVLRDFSQLSVNIFRPVNGLPDEDLKLVWSQLAQGSVWVSRPAKYQGPEDIIALKEYCKALKGKDKLGKAIVRYWTTRYQEDFNTWGQLAVSYTIPELWLGEMLKYLPEKPEKEVVTKDVSSSDGDDEDSSKKKKRPKKKSTSVDVLPSQIKMQLHKFHCAKHGLEIPQRLEPLEVLQIKDITQYQLTLDEKLDCKLVFLDLTHPDLVTWEKQEFSCFLGIVKELTSSEGFAIVAVMEFGKQLVSFSAALKELKDARVLMECGCYEGPKLQRSIDLLSPSWQLVYAYVSFGPEDYKPSFCSTEGLHPTCNEFATKKGLEDVEPEKGENAVQLNLKNKLPRWEFVNLSSPDDEPLTHHLCKRRGFCYRMVVSYSEEDRTVLDFFSGGIFTREALFSHRDVIYFAHSEKEAIFVKEYAKALLRCSTRVRSWYERYKSLKVPTSLSPPPALASSSQQPGLASTSQQAARAVADEDEIEDTDAAKFVFDADVENEARTNFGNARRRVAFNKNIV
ncbi:hypothetical protein R1sor_005267 [Riccia sorocarpa]|uniref:Uncharacterized protein n=1 Tax=Riccia sorocarpa TaxID=122646 RepID=A0ABD3HNB8_9MARC